MYKARFIAFVALLALTTVGSLLVLNLNPLALSSVKATAQTTGLAYLPEDSDLVVHVNVNRALNSPLFSRLLSSPDALNKLEMFIREVGLDPRQDISEVLVGGKTPGAEPVLFVRGPLLRDKINEYIRRKSEISVEMENYKGLDLLKFSQNSRDALVFLDSNLLGVGPRKSVESAIDVFSGATPSVLNNSKMMGLISQVNQGDTFWLATTNGHFSMPPVKQLSQWPLAKAKIDNLVVSGNLDSAVSGKILGFFEDAEAAKDFAAMSRGLLAFGRMQNPQFTELMQVLDGLRIEDYRNQVTLSVQIPYNVLEPLLNRHNQVINIR